jgi:hypothetical protein
MGIDIMEFGCPHPIYFNYFFAQKEFMSGFASFMKNAIYVMIHDPELSRLLMINSGYLKPFPLQQQFGINYWPMHAFVAERLISIYIKLTNPKVEYFL